MMFFKYIDMETSIVILSTICTPLDTPRTVAAIGNDR